MLHYFLLVVLRYLISGSMGLLLQLVSVQLHLDLDAAWKISKVLLRFYFLLLIMFTINKAGAAISSTCVVDNQSLVLILKLLKPTSPILCSDAPEDLEVAEEPR